MVHIATAPPAVEEVLALLRPGDILTHAYTGLTERLVDEGGAVKAAALDARESGVVARHRPWLRARSRSIRRRPSRRPASGPDTISTDLHQVSLPGPNLLDPLAQDIVARVSGDGTPAFTLLTVMSKFLHLGMPLRTSSRRRRRGPPPCSGSRPAPARSLWARLPMSRSCACRAAGTSSSTSMASDGRPTGSSSTRPRSSAVA